MAHSQVPSDTALKWTEKMPRDDTDTQMISGAETGGKKWGLHVILSVTQKILPTTSKTTVGTQTANNVQLLRYAFLTNHTTKCKFI